MSRLSGFQHCERLADVLIKQASKEQLTECVRPLVLNLVRYQGLYGDAPLDDALAGLCENGK
jgi:hypothetical protein